MRITPLDVRKQEFRKAVRGYDSDEVRGFLTTLSEEYEMVLVDNKNLRETIAKQEEKLSEYTKLEGTLRDTLMTAQKVMADTKANAAEEGRLIVEQAKQQAREIMSEARVGTEQLRREMMDLRREKETYLARFRSLAQAQIQFVDSHEQDFTAQDRRLTENTDFLAGDVGSSTQGMTAAPPVATSYPTAAPGVETVPAPAAEAATVPTAATAPSAPAPAPTASTADTGVQDQWRDYAPLTTGAGQEQDLPAAELTDEATEQVVNSLTEAVEMATMGIPVEPVVTDAPEQAPEAAVSPAEQQAPDVVVPV